MMKNTQGKLSFKLTSDHSTTTPLTLSPIGAVVSGILMTREFIMTDSPGEGKVLVSDEDGKGTWTELAIPTVEYWFDNGKDIYTDFRRVGIRTSEPRGKLEINQDEASKYSIILNKTSWDTGTMSNVIRFDSSGTERWAIGHSYRNESLNKFSIWNHYRFKTAFFINGMNGNVGIETEWPAAKLDVNGSFKALSAGIGCNPPSTSSWWKLYVDGGIMARELKVTISNFPDYVFSDSHKLMTIPELEGYIQANKHLPGLPSAQEVEREGGFEVGKMQTLLLEKIEEQALYIISLQKQIEEMKRLMTPDKTR